MPDPWPRRLVALFLHAPGLWLIYRESLPRELRRANLLAAAATAAAMAATSWLLPAPWGWPRGLIATWVAGHLAWGTYLAVVLPRRFRRSDESDAASFSSPH